MQHRADSNDGCHECNGGENHLSFEKNIHDVEIYTRVLIGQTLPHSIVLCRCLYKANRFIG